MSQPVNVCNPIRATQMLSPNELASFPKSLNRVRFFCSTILTDGAGDVSVETKAEHHDFFVFRCHYDYL